MGYTKRQAVYKTLPTGKTNGITNLAFLEGEKGVYKIYENGVLVYVGFSGVNLYKTILRHFEKWNDTEQKKRISYQKNLGKFDYTFEVDLNFKSETAIKKREKEEILKFEPRDNKLLTTFSGYTGKSKLDEAKDNKKLGLKLTKAKKAKKTASKKRTVKKVVKKQDDNGIIPF